MTLLSVPNLPHPQILAGLFDPESVLVRATRLWRSRHELCFLPNETVLLRGGRSIVLVILVVVSRAASQAGLERGLTRQ
jgi:hypothetical protein